MVYLPKQVCVQELIGDINRLKMQRDLKEMVDEGIFSVEGVTHQLVRRRSTER